MSEAKKFWEQEYSYGSPHFLALASHTPSSAAVKFVGYLEEKGLPLEGDLVEVGCGMGRNSNYLGRYFNVTGVDFSRVALKEARKRARGLCVDVRYRLFDVCKRWPLGDNEADYVIDLVTSHLLPAVQLGRYIQNLARVLKPGGRFLLYTLDRTRDEQSQRLLREHPGPEENTYVIPQMKNIVERAFSLEEIASRYDPLKIEHSQFLCKPTRFEDKVYERYYWWVVMTKGR